MGSKDARHCHGLFRAPNYLGQDVLDGTSCLFLRPEDSHAANDVAMWPEYGERLAPSAASCVGLPDKIVLILLYGEPREL